MTTERAVRWTIDVAGCRFGWDRVSLVNPPIGQTGPAGAGRAATATVARAALALVGLAALLAGGCASARVTGVVPAGSMPGGSDRFHAGAAKSDLTPPPGFPTGGYSLAGSITRGQWGRLYARALYLEDPRGSNLALVACDLWSMPAGLGDRVAELL